MTDASTPSVARTAARPPATPVALGAVLATLALLAFTFRDGLAEMVRRWNDPEYSHAWLIPLLAAYVLTLRLPMLRQLNLAPSWLGVALVGIGLLIFVFGELSSLYIIVQYAFLLTVWGLVLTAVGVPGVRVIWASLAFLVFLVPLPFFIQYNLSAQLQLVSSELGTGILRLMGVPVYLEGNVIDLGNYKLQVVEACSGLRYLFPLMSFGFLCAMIFKGPLWQRWLIFLSSVPITIVMNSFRIAVTGVLVNRFGTESAEGFLHFFEGWVIFTACLALMFLEMGALAALQKRPLVAVFDVEIPPLSLFRGWLGSRRVGAPVVAALAMLATGAVVSVVAAGREEQIPGHVALGAFPLVIGDWQGRERTLSDEELATLKLTDYTLIDYRTPAGSPLVELYVAYYGSQRKGVSAHSPRACLPGSGWQIESLETVELEGISATGSSLPVNRALIAMGDLRLLVYYWFPQRGRNLTNEYLVKWYIFWDSITRNRTDGALVRVVTPVPEVTSVDEADKRLQAFLRMAEPRIYYHLPPAELPGHLLSNRAPAIPALVP